MKTKVITRFAPSPTGELHLGGLRTALFSYLIAEKAKLGGISNQPNMPSIGTFDSGKEAHATSSTHNTKNTSDHTLSKMYLRIEDTDRTRNVIGADKRIIQILDIFGIYSPTSDNAPVYQSSRLDIYKRRASELVGKGEAYPCFCDKQRLEDMRAQQISERRQTGYDGLCSHLSKDAVDAKINDSKGKYTIRMKVPKTISTSNPLSQYTFVSDLVHGIVRFENSSIDDQILMKEDGFPTYHFANVVDDHEMGVTHVIRGDEWLSSTPKHILLYKMFGWEPPIFAHIPLLTNKEGKKLSKRENMTSVQSFLDAGYVPSAILNFVALLGWHPGQGDEEEIFLTKKSLIEKFSIEQLNKSGAVVDIERLNWINGLHMKHILEGKLECDTKKDFLLGEIKRIILQSTSTLDANSSKLEINNDKSLIHRVAFALRDRAKTTKDFGRLGSHFFIEGGILLESVEANEMLRLHTKSEASAIQLMKTILEKFARVIENVNDAEWTSSNLDKSIFKSFIKSEKLKKGDLLFPLRWTLTGLPVGPSVQDTMEILGKKESLIRVKKGAEILSQK